MRPSTDIRNVIHRKQEIISVDAEIVLCSYFSMISINILLWFIVSIWIIRKHVLNMIISHNHLRYIFNILYTTDNTTQILCNWPIVGAVSEHILYIVDEHASKHRQLYSIRTRRRHSACLFTCLLTCAWHSRTNSFGSPECTARARAKMRASVRHSLTHAIRSLTSGWLGPTK